MLSSLYEEIAMRCVDEEKIAMHIAGSLSVEEGDRLFEHIAECGACREMFAVANKTVRDGYEGEPVTEIEAQSILKAINKKMRPSENVGKKIGKFFRWITPSPETFMNPAYAGIRSDTASSVDFICLNPKVSGLETELSGERISSDRVSIHARVLENERAARNVRLTFEKKGNRRMISRLLKDDYEVFENMSLGAYKLSLMRNAKEKGVYSFEIDDNGIIEA